MISGLLLVDKPAGITSFDVVRRVKRALALKKVGHLGTLDPFATGLLPLALGEATKLAQFLLEETKTYLATVRLGVATDTQDVTGRVTAESTHLPVPEEISRAAAGFMGQIEQVPPSYSAVHHEGQRLYKLARQGVTVTAAPRQVVIHRLDIIEMDLPRVTIRVECSKGTYIRTLAHDLGGALGCGAHLEALTRLAVGAFRLAEALPLEQVEKHPDEVPSRLIPLAQCLPRFQTVRVDSQEALRLSQGQALPWPEPDPAAGETVRVVNDGSLVAVAAVRLQGTGRVLAPVRVFHNSC
jgi:tRNA pseudouridine55 synthase